MQTAAASVTCAAGPPDSTVPAAHNGPPGWHGKLPSLGDFVSRRLGAEFIEPWDHWLASGLQALRNAAPNDWLQRYLDSPSWRFVLQPGVLPLAQPGAAGLAPGAQAWAGVLVPSVDRVGRYFPLTLAQPLGAQALQHAQLQAVWRRLTAWDDLARDALHGDWTAEQLEAELQRQQTRHGSLMEVLAAAALPDTGATGELPQFPGQAVSLPGAGDAAEAMHTCLQREAWQRAHGCSWWQAVPDEGPARLWLVRGLPATLAVLFSGADNS